MSAWHILIVMWSCVSDSATSTSTRHLNTIVFENLMTTLEIVILFPKINAVFEIKPENLTVFLHDGEVVNFTCAAEESLTTRLRVYKNNMPVNVIDPHDIDYYSTTKTNEHGELILVFGVLVAVKVAYNESVIHCQTRRSDGEGEIAEGHFLIQGK